VRKKRFASVKEAACVRPNVRLGNTERPAFLSLPHPACRGTCMSDLSLSRCLLVARTRTGSHAHCRAQHASTRPPASPSPVPAPPPPASGESPRSAFSGRGCIFEKVAKSLRARASDRGRTGRENRLIDRGDFRRNNLECRRIGRRMLRRCRCATTHKVVEGSRANSGLRIVYPWQGWSRIKNLRRQLG